MSNPLIITFKAPTRPLSINESNQMHWASRRRRLEPWRECVWAAWKMADKAEIDAIVDQPVRVSIKIPFPRNARRDPHNYVGTVCKAIIDELVLCGLVPDDTAEWLSLEEPKLVIGDHPVEIHIAARKDA